MSQFNKFIQHIFSIILLSVIIMSNVFTSYAKIQNSGIKLTLTGKTAVIMDLDSGKILYEKNSKIKRHNASTTKLATAIVAVEHNKSLKKRIKISANASTNGSSPDAVKLGMSTGDSYYLEDLLYAMLLKSANDSAVAIAEGTSGSEIRFMKQVNKKMKEIGCKNTVFGTPNGLRSSKLHYTTAQDMAYIMRYAYQNQIIRKILKTKNYSFKSMAGRSHTVKNTNYLLNNKDYYCVGKTGNGWTAKYCYAGVYTYKDHSYVLVTLGNDTDSGKWNDAKKMITACKKHAKNVQEELSLNKVLVEVEEDKTFRLKVKKCKGKIHWSVKDEKIASVDNNGVVKTKRPGKTLIYAKIYGKTLKCKVKVLEKDISILTNN